MSSNHFARGSVKLLPILFEVFRMESDDIERLTADILNQAKAAWRNAIKAEARVWGCPDFIPKDPRLGDLEHLKDLAARDAKSIADTWDKDLRRELERLFRARPRGNRFYYFEELERWSEARYVWKSKQIAINTEQEILYYAQDRFREVNGLRGGLYAYVGNPRYVSDTCQRRNRAQLAGITTEEYVQGEQWRPHPNCPHSWQRRNPTPQVCSELVSP